MNASSPADPVFETVSPEMGRLEALRNLEEMTRASSFDWRGLLWPVLMTVVLCALVFKVSFGSSQWTLFLMSLTTVMTWSDYCRKKSGAKWYLVTRQLRIFAEELNELRSAKR